jgi:hypothetical protein
MTGQARGLQPLAGFAGLEVTAESGYEHLR